MHRPRTGGRPDAGARAMTDDTLVFLREIDAGTDNACWTVCNVADPGAVAFVPADGGLHAPDLRTLVDWTHLYATEGHAWPSTKTISDPLIALAKSRKPTQADADRLKAGATLRQIASARDSVPRAG